MAHKVIIALRNPFVKWDRRYVSKPCLVWMTRATGHDDGRGMPSVRYLLMFYDLKGRVKRHFELNVFDRKGP